MALKMADTRLQAKIEALERVRQETEQARREAEEVADSPKALLTGEGFLVCAAYLFRLVPWMAVESIPICVRIGFYRRVHGPNAAPYFSLPMQSTHTTIASPFFVKP
jgi:fructoselysine-6-P-deglycase FrlB-like protein